MENPCGNEFCRPEPLRFRPAFHERGGLVSVRRLLSFPSSHRPSKSNSQNILSVWDLLRDVWMRTHRKRVCTCSFFPLRLTRLSDLGVTCGIGPYRWTLPNCMSQKYVHPQADVARNMFSRLGGTVRSGGFGARQRHRHKQSKTRKDSGERGRNRTFNLLIKSQSSALLSC